jgi:hypothetical protein
LYIVTYDEYLNAVEWESLSLINYT